MLWVPSDATADAEGFVLSHSFDKPAALAMKACSSNKKEDPWNCIFLFYIDLDYELKRKLKLHYRQCM